MAGKEHLVLKGKTCSFNWRILGTSGDSFREPAFGVTGNTEKSSNQEIDFIARLKA